MDPSEIVAIDIGDPTTVNRAGETGLFSIKIIREIGRGPPCLNIGAARLIVVSDSQSPAILFEKEKGAVLLEPCPTGVPLHSLSQGNADLKETIRIMKADRTIAANGDGLEILRSKKISQSDVIRRPGKAMGHIGKKDQVFTRRPDAEDFNISVSLFFLDGNRCFNRVFSPEVLSVLKGHPLSFNGQADRFFSLSRDDQLVKTGELQLGPPVSGQTPMGVCRGKCFILTSIKDKLGEDSQLFPTSC